MAQRGEVVLPCAEVSHKLCQSVVQVGMRVFAGGELEQDFVGVQCAKQEQVFGLLPAAHPFGTVQGFEFFFAEPGDA